MSRRRTGEPASTGDVVDATGEWLAVCDEILAGLAHAMNNRLAAIGSIAHVLEFEEPGEPSLRDVLLLEVEALESTIHLLGLIPRTPSDVIEPVRLQDLLPAIARLHRLRGSVRDLELDLHCSETTPPILADPVLLLRAVLVAMGPISRAAMASGMRKIEIRCEAEEGVAIQIAGAGPMKTDGNEDRESLGGVRMLAAEAGAELLEMRTEGGEVVGLRLRFGEN